MLFHEEEANTILRLSDKLGRPFSPVEVTFSEGDKYLCEFNTSWESDNGLDEGDPEFDEYWEKWYDVIDVLTPGPNLEYSYSSDGKKNPVILLTYKHFPERITTLDGTVVYEKGDSK